jgi:purine-binding chemotaxis protein CheW
MSALALDEFSMEMRQHYIATTCESLLRFKSETEFSADLNESLAGWISEAASNSMNFFAKLLVDVKEARVLPVEALISYLEVLKTQEDSQEFYLKFSAALSKATESEVQLYLQCLSGQHYFLVPVLSVVEIIGNKSVFPLPMHQRGIKGLMTYRGQAIPVMDLNEFGFHASELKAEKTFYVVCEMEEGLFSIEVNKTDEVLEFSSSQFQTSGETPISSPVVDRFIVRENKTWMLLDIKKLVK